MLDHELNAFGMRMGLPGLAFSPQGLVALDVSGMGRLYFEKQQRHGREELLVYLARPFPPHDSTLPERALALCHYRHAHAFSLTAGMKGDTLILLTRLPERQTTAALLESRGIRNLTLTASGIGRYVAIFAAFLAAGKLRLRLETPPPTLDAFVDAITDLSEQVVLGEPLAADEPEWEQYLIPVKCGVFRKWSRLDERRTPPDMECMKTSYTFPGCFNYLDSYEVPANSLYMMKFEFKIEERKRVRVVFNSNAISRVWLDGEFAFGRDGGWMSPSYSSVPLNQFADVEVEAGVHTLVVGVAPNEPDENIYWVMGVAASLDKQWLPYTFFDNGDEV